MNHNDAIATITEACETHGATKVFALFSGGDDSLSALRVAMEHPRFTAAVHLITGVGVAASTEFARETCRELRCPLIEYCARDNVRANGTPDPQHYEQMVMEHGFPGPTKFGHGMMYARLKERSLRRLQREHSNRGERIVFASGARSEESTRRMGTTERIARHGRQVWVNHIHDWTKTDTHNYRKAKGLKRNPVAELICKSGECLCGGFGNEGELEELTAYDLTRPLGYHLLDLQKKVTEIFPWKWHERPPTWWLATKRGQRFMFEMNKYPAPGPMCQGCEKRAEALLDA